MGGDVLAERTIEFSAVIKRTDDMTIDEKFSMLERRAG